jgi:hypothetical protein
MKLGKSATKTPEMLREAFGKHSLSQIAVFEWHSHFKAGRVSVEDDERSGPPSTRKTTENVEKIRELIHEDHNPWAHRHRWDHLWNCKEILTENFNICCIAAKLFPRHLTNDQKQRCVNMS